MLETHVEDGIELHHMEEFQEDGKWKKRPSGGTYWKWVPTCKICGEILEAIGCLCYSSKEVMMADQENTYYCAGSCYWSTMPEPEKEEWREQIRETWPDYDERIVEEYAADRANESLMDISDMTESDMECEIHF